MAGLESTGFVPKTLSEIRTDLEAGFRATFGDSIDLDPRSVFGQIIGIMSERFAEVWEVAAAVDAGKDPDRAEGQALYEIGALTSMSPNPAQPTTVTVTATGDPATVLIASREVSVSATGARFTLAAETIVALSAWLATTAYGIGARVTNSGNAYECIAAGTSAGAGGPTTTEDDITDGTVHWNYLGEGTAAVDVLATCTLDGPTPALAGAVDTIETPVAGWLGITNVLDAAPGAYVESDAAFRARRESEIAAPGESTLNAIRTDVLRVADVTACQVFQNTSNATVDSLPPKSVEAVVIGGLDQDIFDALFNTVAAGIETYGTEVGASTDPNGDSQPVKFSRPVDLDIYIVASVIKDPREFPPDGEAQIKSKIVELGDLYPLGKNAVATALSSMIFEIPGVLDVTSLFLGTAPSPGTSATVEVSPRERAVFDTSRITLTLISGVP